ncbi:MAG: DUF362 domain-containing protein [Anaerolineae bacterium]|nr:DUF362 domain-containing protein [Anaerolineae bacterium]
MSHHHHAKHPARFTRRHLLLTAGITAGGLLVGPPQLPERVVHALDNPRPAVVPAANRPTVAIAQANSYNRALIRRRVFDMIDQLGGLGDVVKSGDRVAIKTNLTGGSWAEGMLGVPCTESYITHPAVTRALVEAVLDAGAGEVFLVEAVYDQASWQVWGNQDIADDLGVTLIDLNQPDPFDDFREKRIGPDWLRYETMTMNPLLHDVDVFMSVAKLKCHATAGITLSMKNLVGLVPMQFYRLDDNDTNRSALHGPGYQAHIRIPCVIIDLVRARPIDFSLIDGVMTSEGGEGPWNDGWTPKIANVLVAGKDMVATDAVAAAVMGFNPEAASFAEAPFHFCLNHLQLAHALGLGTHKLNEIEIVGAELADVVVPFRPYAADQTYAAITARAVQPFGGRL